MWRTIDETFIELPLWAWAIYFECLAASMVIVARFQRPSRVLLLFVIPLSGRFMLAAHGVDDSVLAPVGHALHWGGVVVLPIVVLLVIAASAMEAVDTA